ncbi:MAG: PRC-barrel domain-containing protein [Clostridiales bacterium]|nr:PRC-barrel domain-containing protein [Candidatus Apopatousia equi]
MKKVSDFLGKPVISLYESTTEGIVKNLMFDKNFKKLKYIVMFNDNEFQEEKIVAVQDIYSYGENAIILKNNSCLDLKTKLTEELESPINNYVYTILGKYIGIVKDVMIDEKFNIKEIELNDNKTIEIEKVVTSGKDAMFIQEEGTEVKLSYFKNKKIVNKEENKEIKVLVLNKEQLNKNIETENLVNQEVVNNSDGQESSLVEELPQEETFVKPILPKKKVELTGSALPKVATTKKNFLIGRKVAKNIYSFNHEIIIRKNTRITDKTILIAKSHSKLKELALYSE